MAETVEVPKFTQIVPWNNSLAALAEDGSIWIWGNISQNWIKLEKGKAA